MHLETERLILRPWTHDASDVARMLDIQSRIEVVKWLGDGEPVVMRDLAEAHAKVDRYAERSATAPYGFWAVEVRATGLVVGTALLVVLPNSEAGEVEIGWHLHPDSWGHGYASEAATAVLGHGFAHGLPEILAVSHLDNHPSQAVMRRIGMTDRGTTDKWYDDPSALFGMTAEEWAARVADSPPAPDEHPRGGPGVTS